MDVPVIKNDNELVRKDDQGFFFGLLLPMVLDIGALVLVGLDSGCMWRYYLFHGWWCNNLREK